MLKLIIGNKNLSSWSMRPWLLMRQAGIPFDEHVMLFEEAGWREKIIALSPSHRVPALHHSELDVVLWDSLAICEYVAELHPTLNLWPADREARAFARAVSSEMHSSFAHLRGDLSMDVTARFPRRTLSLETQKDVDRILSLWGECRARFGSKAYGPFLFGAFSIADAMFAPVVWRFRSYDVAMDHAPPTARAWYEMMLSLPAMRSWERDAEAEVIAKLPATKSAPDPTSAEHCFAVIFTSELTPAAKSEGYDQDAMRMEELARNEKGFLGIESSRSTDGFGITVSYWDSLEAIARWRVNAEHKQVQNRGREIYYARYELRVCHVERGYKFSRAEPSPTNKAIRETKGE